MEADYETPVRVLHVDDDPDFTDLTAVFLEERDGRFTVETATDASDGLDRLSPDLDCIVSDYEMPGTNGIEFLRTVRKTHPDLPFVLFTGRGSEAVASDAVSAGATHYLQKRSGTEQFELLANRIWNAVSQYRAQRERQRVYQALETSTQGIGILDRDGRYVYLNEAYADLYGRDPEEIRGNHWEMLYPEAEVTRFREEILPTLEDAGKWTGHSRGLHADGTTIAERLWLTRLETGGHVCVVQERAEHAENERELERYETILEALGDPVYAIDEEGRYTFVNGAFTEMTGYSEQRLLGEHTSLVVGESAVEKGIALTRELLRDDDGATRTCELTVTTASGERIPCENHVALLPFDEDGNFRGTAGVIRDISERKERQRQLERQNERLDEFASVVSHDLRSPLSVADGHLELARETCDCSHLETVADAIDRSQALIDDVLTLAQEGKRVGELEPVSIAETVERCWQTVETGEATFVVDTDRRIRADPRPLQQLFENLLSNAVQHGGADVTITVGHLDDGNGFYVADDGRGIPEDERERVLDSGYSTTDGGTGFGLRIVKGIAEAHGWTISVTASDDGGARIEVTDVEFVSHAGSS